MPYNSNAELPPAVRKLPEHKQTKFRVVFNAAHRHHHGDEERAFSIAWSVVKKGKPKGGPAEGNDDG